MSTQRDELANIVDDAWTAGEAADNLLAAGWTRPRTITTFAELDALDVESIIRDIDGLPKEKQSDGEGATFWASPGHAEQFTVDDICLPAVVLYDPTSAAK